MPQTLGDWIGWIVFLLALAWLIARVIREWRDIWLDFPRFQPLVFLFQRFIGIKDMMIPMLLICGDESFCESDEIQLKKANIWFRKLERATLNDVEQELQRRRLDETLYQWVHISAHGTVDGFVLSNEIMTSKWLADHFEGVRVLFAATCDSASVGDSLAGIVDAVIVVYGKRGSGAIATFACAFWREMARTGNVRKSYRTALEEVPQLRPFVDLRLK